MLTAWPTITILVSRKLGYQKDDSQKKRGLTKVQSSGGTGGKEFRVNPVRD